MGVAPAGEGGFVQRSNYTAASQQVLSEALHVTPAKAASQLVPTDAPHVTPANAGAQEWLEA
jgi:hypothetical protein